MAIEHVARGDASLGKLGFLALRLAEVLDDLRPHILIEPDDLKLRLADLGFGLGNRGNQLAALAFDPRALALQGREPRQRYETLVEQLLHAREFARDQLQLLGLGGDLGLRASISWPSCAYRCSAAALSGSRVRSPRPEQRSLGRQQGS